MMSQFSFDLDNYEMPDSVEVTGCIRTQNMYPISSRDSSIRVIFENLNASCSVLLNVDDHPANWEVTGEVPVSLTLQSNPAGHGYIGENLKVLNRYSSFEHLPFKYVPVREILNSTQVWIDSCPYDSLKTFMYAVLGKPSVGSLETVIKSV